MTAQATRSLALGLCALLCAPFAEAQAESARSKPSTAPPITSTLSIWQEADVPARETLGLTFAFPELRWWEAFQDQQLATYIDEALAQSPTVAQATDRVAEARALTRQTLANELPSLSIEGNYTRQRNSATLFAPSVRNFTNGTAQNGTSGATATAPATTTTQGPGAFVFAPGRPINLFTLPLRASYEVDYLLKNRTATRAQQQQVVATEAERRNAVLTLTTELGGAYFNLVQADRQVALQQQTVAAARESLTLVQAREAAGLAARGEVLQAEEALNQAEALIPELQRQQSSFERQVKTLMGRSPGDIRPIARTDWVTLCTPPVTPVGVPSEVLTRRPDIQQAEALLAQARLNASVARKQLFPSLTLSGQFGFASSQLEQLFDWQSRLYAFGGTLAQDLFAGGRRIANLRVQQARARQQLSSYQQTVLTAFQEVEDSLATLKANTQEADRRQARLTALTERLSLTQARYEAGLIAFPEVLADRQAVLAAQRDVATVQAAGLVDRISLIRALGGGF